MNHFHLLSVIKTVSAAVGGIVGFFLGGSDAQLIALAALVALDYISGVAAAVALGEICCDIGFKGIAKKVFIFVMVAAAHLADESLAFTGAALRDVVIFFYIANEGLSIIKNAARAGLPVPEKVREILRIRVKEIKISRINKDIKPANGMDDRDKQKKKKDGQTAVFFHICAGFSVIGIA